MFLFLLYIVGSYSSVSVPDSLCLTDICNGTGGQFWVYKLFKLARIMKGARMISQNCVGAP